MTIDIQRETFVGREQELARLYQFLQDLETSGTRTTASVAPFPLLEESRPIHCVLLTGSEGIGKTRLAEEAAHAAIGRGWEVLWTSVSPHGEETPYHLWTQVLQQAQAHGLIPMPEVTRHPQLYHPLGALLPEINPFLDPTGEQAHTSSRQETGRLWEAMRGLLAAISTRTPLLVVLDDLHQAAVCSIALLAFLARHLPGLPILFLGTCSTRDWSAPHPLHGLLSDLQRDQDAVLLPLPPLSDAAICQLAHHVSTEQAQRIAQAVAGNPFLATELVKSGTSPDELLPASIQAVFGQSLAQVSSPCQRLLTEAATLGESFTFDALCTAVRGTMTAQADWVLDLVEEALHAHLLTETVTAASITYRFAPPLLHTALVQPKRRPGRRKPIVLSLLLALLLVSTWGWWLWNGVAPQRVLEQMTAQIIAMTGQPDAARHEVQARWVSAQSPRQSVLLYAPGPIPAQRASGYLLFVNTGAVPVTFPTTTLIGASGVAITFNGPLTIPALSPPVAVIPGFTVQAHVGALPAFDLDQPCCAAGVVVKNEAFAQESDVRLSPTISQDAITHEVSGLSQAGALNLSPQLDRERTPTERVVPHSFQCVSHPLTAPSTARSMVVQAAVTCREALYDQAQVLRQVRTFLGTQATHDLGAHAVLAGPIALQVVSATITPTRIVLRVQVQGTWRA